MTIRRQELCSGYRCESLQLIEKFTLNAVLQDGDSPRVLSYIEKLVFLLPEDSISSEYTRLTNQH